MTDGYWFARYRLGANPSRGLAPLNWKGRAVVGGFVAGLLLGGLLFLLLSLNGQMAWGVAVFAVCGIASGSTFLWAAMTRSDPLRTVADYRAGEPE